VLSTPEEESVEQGHDAGMSAAHPHDLDFAPQATIAGTRKGGHSAPRNMGRTMFNLKFGLGRSLFLGTALAWAVTASPSRADLDAAKLKAATAAADKFVAKSAGSEKSGDAPRQSDPAVMQMLDAVFDLRDVQGHPVPFSQIGDLSQRMMTGLKVGVVYMLAGTGAIDLNQIGQVADATTKVNLNVIKFGPEMGRFFDYQLRIQTAVVDTVLTRLAVASRTEVANPKFQSGLADIRGGSQRVASGLIETLAVNGVTDAWRRERMPALLAMAPSLAKFLQPDQKAQLHELAIACANVMDDAQVKDGLQQFAKTMAG
jgi:hypothetical protein